MYAYNNRFPKYMKQKSKELNVETGSNTIIVEDLNASLSMMDRTTRQKSKKETYLSNTLVQMDLTDISRAFHPIASLYTCFEIRHGTFYRIDHILCHKASLNKVKKTEFCQVLFFN